MWRIYYEDTVYEGTPEQSPAWGVVAIAQRDVDYDNVLCSGVPWYVFRKDLGYWVELDNIGFHDVLLTNVHNVSAVRPGRDIPTSQFKLIWAEAREWANG